MELFEKIRNAKGDEFARLARSIADDRTRVYSAVVALAQSGMPDDFERIAAVLSYATVDGTERTEHYSDRRGAVGKGYVDMFVAACNACNYPESDYIKVLLYAQYAKEGGALYGWRDGADAYIEKLAKTDFYRAAGYIDKYDGKFGKYDILIRTDPSEAVKLLLDKVLYGKNLNKTAIRRILMERPEIVNALAAAYGDSNAKTRAAITRILMLFKTDGRVKDILDEARSDPSKTVRDLFEKRESVPTDAVAFFERLMAAGEPVEYGRLRSLMTDGGKDRGKNKNKFAAVADRIFFYVTDDGVNKTVLMCDGGRFADLGGATVVLNEKSELYVLHPLDLDAASPLLTAEIEQPFLQLARPMYYASPDDGTRSSRLFGTFIDKKTFERGLRLGGFSFAADGDGMRIAVSYCGDYAVAVSCRLPDGGDTAECLEIGYYRTADVVRLGRDAFIGSANALRAGSLPRRAFSELTYAAYKLFGCV